MLGQIDLVTLVVEDVRRCAAFYRDALGFAVADEAAALPDDYLEFGHAGVRFALRARSVLASATGHPSLHERRTGQAVELAIRLGDAAEVDATFERLIARGVRPVAPPAQMPWGQRTAFIADPEGNLLELIADLPAATPDAAGEGTA